MRKLKKKPCPLCGDKRILLYRIMTRHWHEKKWFCKCQYCHLCAKSAFTAHGAIRLWNKATNVKSVAGML